MSLSGGKAAAFLVVLLASLALNLFVGGLLLGRDLRPPAPQARDERAGPLGLASLVPTGARPAVRELLQGRRPEVEQRLRDLRESRRQAYATLRAEPFDPDRARTAFTALRERTLAVQQLVQDLLIDAASHASPDQRTSWATGQPGRAPP